MSARERREIWLDAALVVVVQAMLCVLVRRSGFDHVSDDDFARVTIAESFAQAPKLDPSGTSWLPFPFWMTGIPLALFGRSLAVARVVSIALSSLAAPLPYLALRFTGRPRMASLGAFAFFALSPWSIWLAASTTPESMTASFTAAAAIGLAAVPPLRWCVLPLIAACLSRYEPWPAAAVLAIALGARRDRKLVPYAVLAAVGPLLWMAWNAHAHDGPLHFFRRVSRYKQRIGEGTTDAIAALLLYPKLLVVHRPDLAVAGSLAMFFEKKRWLVPLLAAVAIVGFLAIGNARDGAPTHHPERALLPVFAILAAFAADVCVSAIQQRRTMIVLGLVVGIAWIATLRPLFDAPPGSSADEDRSAAIVTGASLRAEPHVTVTPCAYEHFATIAAYGSPASVTINAAAPSDAGCPVVTAP